jgi:hypothetical protein
MKKGVILYVTEGKEEIQMLQDQPDLQDASRLLGVNAVCLATSEDEIAYGWWQLIARGIQQISCMKAAYHVGPGTIEPFGMPLRLCG